MRTLKTFCAATLLLLALSIPTHAGDMECGFIPPPPLTAVQSHSANYSESPQVSESQQDSTDTAESNMLISVINWLFGIAKLT